MSKTTRWWWIRHAPVVGHDGRLYGRRDVAADLSDITALKTLAEKLPERAVWIASPLMRTVNTAQTLAALHAESGSLPIIHIEPDIIEQDFGGWQGKTYGEIAELQGGETHPLWFAPAEVTPEGGESFVATMKRVAGAIERLTGAHAKSEIVAVAHAGVIRAAVAHALDLSAETALRLAIEPLSLTRLDHIAGKDGVYWHVMGVNAPS